MASPGAASQAYKEGGGSPKGRKRPRARSFSNCQFERLARGSLLIGFTESLASKAIEYQRKFLRAGGVNSSMTATHSSWLRKTWAERAE
jgi:hypothetical protein